jgi:hypothetical protein
MRLAPLLNDKWCRLGISKAIHASKFELPMNPALLSALTVFWFPMTNTFSFPEGFMTLTVLDVFSLTCLPLNGVSVHSLMTCGSGPNVSIINKGDALSYGGFITQCKGFGNATLTYPEECSFYFLWICRFLAHSSSKQIMKNYLRLAIALTNGVCVALNPFILGELYRAIYHISTEPNPSHEGPLWLMQMWVYSYFPTISDELNPSKELRSYGEAWMHVKYDGETPSFPTCFTLFSDTSRRRF